MDPDTDLQSLMARYQLGDSDAATALVYHLSPQLHRFFMVKVVSRRHAVDEVIRKLNPILNGWCTYFRAGNSSRIFHLIDCLLYRSP
jgi:Group II intron, maturase-specific domain